MALVNVHQIVGVMAEGGALKFSLKYRGPLASNGNAREKHRIRREFHIQLRELWRTSELLRSVAEKEVECVDEGTGKTHEVPNLQWIGMHFVQYPYTFVPLVTRDLRLVCSLDIKFFRRSEPGELVKHGGDIDNRIKTLLDALSVPSKEQVVESVAREDEKPFFYCLVEDDSLISGLCVETEKLILPPVENEGKHDVQLDIEVQVSPTVPTIGNLGF
jgi:hypothetical protein